MILAFFGVVGLVLYLKPGGKDVPVDKPALAIFAAGPDGDFLNGTVTYFENEHFYLVRQPDGAFVALYNLSPVSQMGVNQGDLTRLDCRLQLIDLTTSEHAAGPPKTFEANGFFDPCSQGVWDTAGKAIRGEVNGDLDRFPVSTIDDIVRVDLGARRCVNPVSATAPCISTR
jgi:hypothetical protein